MSLKLVLLSDNHLKNPAAVTFTSISESGHNKSKYS